MHTPAVPTGPSRSSSRPLPAFSGALVHIERTWLGLHAPPWNVRAHESAWTPSEPDDFCWRCGRTAGPFEVAPPESQTPGCSVCVSQKLPWERFIRVGEYAGVLRKAIHETKFHRVHALGASLGRELGVAIARELRWEGHDPADCILVPVPASWRRRLASGIDHALAIARAAGEVSGCAVRRPIRRRHGPSQLQVPPSQRLRNAARSFLPASLWYPAAGRLPPCLRQGRGVVVVVDDVRTTGATMQGACRALASALALHLPVRPRIWAAVVAVTPEPGRQNSSANEPRPSDPLDPA